MLYAATYLLGVLSGMCLFKYIRHKLRIKHQRRPIIHECVCTIL